MDAGVTEDDIICGSGASQVDISDIDVEAEESEEESEEGSAEGTSEGSGIGIIPIKPGNIGEWITNTDWDGDGYSYNEGDCSPQDASVYPGAAEICDELDNNCDGEIDEGVEPETYYEDRDDDYYGNPDASVESCSQPPHYVPDNTDCNDLNYEIYPGTTELCNNVDDNCDGVIDENCEADTTDANDKDGDGYSIDVDCNDSNSGIHPGATENPNDNADDNCDGVGDEEISEETSEGSPEGVFEEDSEEGSEENSEGSSDSDENNLCEDGSVPSETVPCVNPNVDSNDQENASGCGCQIHSESTITHFQNFLLLGSLFPLIIWRFRSKCRAQGVRQICG